MQKIAYAFSSCQMKTHESLIMQGYKDHANNAPLTELKEDCEVLGKRV